MSRSSIEMRTELRDAVGTETKIAVDSRHFVMASFL